MYCGLEYIELSLGEWNTRVARKNRAIEREMCIDFAQLYLRDG